MRPGGCFKNRTDFGSLLWNYMKFWTLYLSHTAKSQRFTSTSTLSSQVLSHVLSPLWFCSAVNSWECVLCKVLYNLTSKHYKIEVGNVYGLWILWDFVGFRQTEMCLMGETYSFGLQLHSVVHQTCQKCWIFYCIYSRRCNDWKHNVLSALLFKSLGMCMVF